MRIVWLVIGFSSIGFAETNLDQSYRKIYEYFSGQNCSSIQQSNLIQCDPGKLTAKNLKDFSNFNEATYFTKLSELELERLKCGADYWKSLVEPSNQETFINLIQEKLPKLNSIRKEINDLSVRNALLNGKIPKGNYAHLQNMNDPYKNLRSEYERNNSEIKKLTELYELIISGIPHSDVPLFRDFIEAKAGTSGLSLKNVQPISEAEFRSLTGKISQGFLQSTQSIIKSKKNDGFYDLSGELKERLGTDSYLVGRLTQQHPESAALIEKYQCQTLHRKKGREGVWDGVSYLGTALSLGAPAVIGAARLVWVSRAASTAKSAQSVTSNVSRLVSFSAMFTGAGASVSELANQCFKGDSSLIKDSCSQTPQTITQSKDLSNCILIASVTGVSYASGPLERVIKTHISSARSVGDVKIGSNLAGKNTKVDVIKNLPDSGNKSRLLGDEISKTNPLEGSKEYKKAAERYGKELAGKNSSINELSDLEYVTARWAAQTTNLEDKVLAEKKFIEAFQQRMKLEKVTMDKARSKAQTIESIQANTFSERGFIIDRIGYLKSDLGSGSHKDGSLWQIEVLNKLLKSK